MGDDAVETLHAPEVSVVIVNWNARAALERCLDSLRECPPSLVWEAIVVDNASTDGSVDWLRKEAPWVRLIANPRNRGLAAANNQGFVTAAGETVLVSNPDVRFTLGAIDSLLAMLRDHPEAGIAVPGLLQSAGARQVSVGDLPTFREAFLGRFSKDARSRFWWRNWDHESDVAVGHGQEACYLVRRSALVSVGPQDERFVLDWEGLDWSARFGAAGWEIWFCHAADVWHEGGASVRQARVRWILNTHRGMYRYFSKRSRLPLKPALFAACTARAAVKLARIAVSPDEYDRARSLSRL